MPLRVDCEPRIGTGRNARAIRDTEGNAVVERRWLLGPVEGLIWAILFSFAIGVILYLIARPYVADSPVVAPASRVVERVVERPAPAPTPAPIVRPAPPPRELTPEEQAEQYKEERRRQYGIR